MLIEFATCSKTAMQALVHTQVICFKILPIPYDWMKASSCTPTLPSSMTKRSVDWHA